MITESKFKNILAPIITYFKKTDINSRGLADPNNFAWHARFLLQSARLPDSSSTASLTPKILRHFKPLAEVISQNFEIYRRRPILEGSALLTQALHDVCCFSNVQFIIELIMDNPSVATHSDWKAGELEALLVVPITWFLDFAVDVKRGLPAVMAAVDRTMADPSATYEDCEFVCHELQKISPLLLFLLHKVVSLYSELKKQGKTHPQLLQLSNRIMPYATYCNAVKAVFSMIGKSLNGDPVLKPSMRCLALYVDVLEELTMESEVQRQTMTACEKQDTERGISVDVVFDFFQFMAIIDEEREPLEQRTARSIEFIEDGLHESVLMASYWIMLLPDPGKAMSPALSSRLCSSAGLGRLQSAATGMKRLAQFCSEGDGNGLVCAHVICSACHLSLSFVYSISLVWRYKGVGPNAVTEADVIKLYDSISMVVDAWMEFKDVFESHRKNPVLRQLSKVFLCSFVWILTAQRFIEGLAKHQGSLYDAGRPKAKYMNSSVLPSFLRAADAVQVLSTHIARKHFPQVPSSFAENLHIAPFLKLNMAFCTMSQAFYAVNETLISQRGPEIWELCRRVVQSSCRASLAWSNIPLKSGSNFYVGECRSLDGPYPLGVEDATAIVTVTPEMWLLFADVFYPGCVTVTLRHEMMGLILDVMHAEERGNPLYSDYCTDVSLYEVICRVMEGYTSPLAGILNEAEISFLMEMQTSLKRYAREQSPRRGSNEHQFLMAALETLKRVLTEARASAAGSNDDANPAEKDGARATGRTMVLGTLQCANLGCISTRKAYEDVLVGKVCSGCHEVRYCSRECQKQSWKAHKFACSLISFAKEGGSFQRAD